MKYRITYNESDTTNKTKIVEAEDSNQALTIFYGENSAVDVTKVEVLENEAL